MSGEWDEMETAGVNWIEWRDAGAMLPLRPTSSAATAAVPASPHAGWSANRMRFLILGGSGMLGHKLWQRARGRVDAFVTLRRTRGDMPVPELWDDPHVVEQVDARDPSRVAAVLDEVRPDVVINCIGIVKAHAVRMDAATVAQVNAAFPQQLAKLTIARGMRLLHISTDCVFRGDRGAITKAMRPMPTICMARRKRAASRPGPAC
jgi:dTDP-4-dehydrorhamnose reductase